MASISHHFGELGIIENDNILLPVNWCHLVCEGPNERVWHFVYLSYWHNTTDIKAVESNSLPYNPQIFFRLSVSFDFLWLLMTKGLVGKYISKCIECSLWTLFLISSQAILVILSKVLQILSSSSLSTFGPNFELQFKNKSVAQLITSQLVSFPISMSPALYLNTAMNHLQAMAVINQLSCAFQQQVFGAWHWPASINFLLVCLCVIQLTCWWYLSIMREDARLGFCLFVFFGFVFLF